MRGSEEALRIMEQALAIAAPEADEAEVSLGGGSIGVTRFASNNVHQSVQLDREVMAIRVRIGGRIGRAETSDFTTHGIQSAAKQAKTLAELLPDSDEPVGFPGPQAYVPVDAYDAETERAGSLDRMMFAGSTIIRAHKERLSTSGAVASCFGGIDPGAGPDGIYAIGNTNGLAAYHAGTRGSFSVTMFGRDGKSGWAEASSHALGAIDAEATADIATGKALAPGALKEIKPGRYTAILEPAAASALLRFVALTAGADRMTSGTSFLSGRIGAKLAADGVTIADDHSHDLHRGLSFDDEGVARRRVVLIEDGVAKGPVYSYASALRYGVEPTGHGVRGIDGTPAEEARHLVMSGGDATLTDLLGSTRAGVLITRFWGAKILDERDLFVSAVTSDGTFLIDKGEIVAPVREMRIELSVLDLLASIDGMTQAEWAGGLVVPGMRVHDLPLVSLAAP